MHIALRGTGVTGSVRCDWRGIARTPEQREEAIRFWLELGETDKVPPPAELDRIKAAYAVTVKSNFRSLAQGGLSTEYVFLTCYADYTVSEYLLGSGVSGVSKLTVAYDRLGEARSYALYKKAHAGGEFGAEALMTEGEYDEYLDVLVSGVEQSLIGVLEGREAVVFLAPMGAHNAIAVEAWQAVTQWDVATGDDGTVNVVRYGANEGDPEHTQTLSGLKGRITAATATGSGMPALGADGVSTITPTPAATRIPNVGKLTDYYKSIGAYGFIGPYPTATPSPAGSVSSPSGSAPTESGSSFTPAQPPPVYAPAPTSLTATAQGMGSVKLAWGAVSGASGYHAQYREVDSEDWWSTSSKTITGATHTVTDLSCGTSYEFRVGGYGNGVGYNSRAGLWSTAVSATTGACPTPTPAPPSLSPDPSTVNFVADGSQWHEFTVHSTGTVIVEANPGNLGDSRVVEIANFDPGRSYCPAEWVDDKSSGNGQKIYLSGCVAGTGTVELEAGGLTRTYTFTISPIPTPTPTPTGPTPTPTPTLTPTPTPTPGTGAPTWTLLDNGAVHVTWNAVSGAKEYQIGYSLAGSGMWNVVGGSKITTASKNLVISACGVSFQFRVRAKHADDSWGGWSGGSTTFSKPCA